ncbi:hypothetical protein PIB30_078769, partial [Stylosanthes scabra]|nr:hypothetical protein [Stylosanthes scabra]
MLESLSIDSELGAIFIIHDLNVTIRRDVCNCEGSRPYFDGLTLQSRAQIDSSAGRSLHTKIVEEAQDLIELVVNNQYLYSTPSERGTVKKGVMEAEAIDTLMAQTKALAQQINLINSKLGTMQLAAANTQIGPCDLCGIHGHSSE